MRFTTLAIDDPEVVGSILAHTHRLGGGAFKKGRRLVEDDVRRLRDVGARDVMVALLEPGDVHEDAAAARVATWFTGKGLEHGTAHTGRLNLCARHDGLVVIDHDAIDTLNAVDEGVTVATVRQHSPTRALAMVATIKIIPFAVRESTLAAIGDRIAGRELIDVRPFHPRRVGLVMTTLDNLPGTLLDRASSAQRQRVQRLGSTLTHEQRCPHDEAAVADALMRMARDGAEVLLVLGASAIVDRRDTVPAGLTRAGGTIIQLGMPVDPGNLLMLGDLHGVPVIGLPGCARSLAPSGFDFVLQRLLAGLPVDAATVRGMGVGGLLKSHAADFGGGREAVKTAAVVLAAGMSSRMGVNKLLIPIDGKPMVAHVVDTLLASPVASVVVVLGHQADAVRAALHDRPVRFVHNPSYAEGLSTSLRCGVQALARDGVDAALIGLGDMPWVSSRVLETLIDAFDADAGASICVPAFGKKRGNPVLWAARHFDELASLTGDVGGKVLFGRHESSLREVAVAEAAVTIDIDTPDAIPR